MLKEFTDNKTYTEKEIKNCVKKLVLTANERGGHDNITVCAMKVSACE